MSATGRHFKSGNRGLWLIWVVLAMAGIPSFFFGADEEGLPAVVQRPFSRSLILTGELRAANSVAIQVPDLRKVQNFVITYLAAEGSLVNPGEVLIKFDITELELTQLNLERRQEEALTEISQTEADIETRLSELELSHAVAEKALKVARLYAEIDPELIPRSDHEQYLFNLSRAELSLEKAQERLNNHLKSAKIEMEVARLEYEHCDLELQRVLADIEMMTVRAPIPGLVVYEDNWYLGRKYQIGDSVRRKQGILRLPNLDKMLVRAVVHDVDFPYLIPGMRAKIRLDAYPERTFSAELSRLPELGRPLNRDSQLRIFLVEFLMLETDLSVMRSGMTAQVEVVLPPQDAFTVPRSCVHLDPEGQPYLLPVGAASSPIRIELIDANEKFVVVNGDVRAGQPLQEVGSNSVSREGSEVDWITVRRQDLIFGVGGTGLLRAESAVEIRPPAIPYYTRFVLVDIVEEGTAVEEGDKLLGFDPSEVERRLRTEQSNGARLTQEYERNQASRELQIRQIETQLEEYRVDMEKAENQLVLAREFESVLKVREADFEAELARKRVQLLERKLTSVRRSAELRLKVLADRRGFYRRRITSYKSALNQFEITSPTSGVVVYRRDYNNRVKEVGSGVYTTDAVLAIPDLNTLGVLGKVAEVDAGKIKIGQEVVVTFDAISEVSYNGSISNVAKIFSRVSHDRPLGVLEIHVELDEVDPDRMRPGMAARLEIVIDRLPNVLAVPLAALDVEGEKTFLWVQEGKEPVRNIVEVGRDNGVVAVIKSGVKEGDKVASRPL